MKTLTKADFEALYRSESRKVLATLVRLLGDFDMAEEALQDILAEAASGGFLGEFGGTPTASPYGGLMQQFGLDEDQARLGAVRFHRLDLWTRRAFCALLIDRQSVEECLELGFGPIERLQSSVRMAMKALLGLSDLWPELEPELEPLDGWVAGEDLHGEV